MAMSDHVTVEFQRVPWEPSGFAQLTEELDRWNRPTLGVLEESGEHYLFRVLENSDAGPDIWVYARLTHDEFEAISEATTADDLEVVVKQAYESRPLVAVLTDERSRIMAAALVDPVQDAQDANLLEAAAQELHQRVAPLIEEVRSERTPRSEFTAELTRLG
jgi:hypothetical protein